MNRESRIIQLRLLDAETQINEFSDKRAKQLSRAYKRKVSMLEQRIKIESEKQLDQVIEYLALESTPAVAESFSIAGMVSKTAVDAALGWDGKYQGLEPAAISQNQLKGLALTEKLNGKTLTEHLDTAIGSEIRKEIAQARIKGEGIDKVTGRIWRSLGGTVSRREIETISITYTATASSYAKRLTYEQNSSVIKGFTWCATLENGDYKTGRGTCPRCAALDQQEYETIGSAPPCPLHHRCRCLLTPVTKTWNEMGLDIQEMEEANRPWTQRLKSGKIEDYGTSGESYGDWWKTQTPEWQNSSTVGPARAQMISDGLIQFQDIVDRNTGRSLTIKQLSKKFNL